MIKWSDHPEYVEFMKDYIPGHVWSETAKAFYVKFGITLTRSHIKNFCNRFGVRSGITNAGCFSKGSIPHNKGKKMSEETYRKVKGTMFKKGNLPHNYRPVGSERVTVDGYVEIKIADPNKWRLKSRVLYEQYHNVKLTKSDVIIFLDGNRLNLDIDNLFLISRAALARFNQDKLYSDNPEMTKAAALMAELKTKTRKKRKKEQSL